MFMMYAFEHILCNTVYTFVFLNQLTDIPKTRCEGFVTGAVVASDT
jgi:membrane associated rhomboid family serine protease